MANNIGIESRDSIQVAMERWLYKYKQMSVKASTFTRLITSFKLLQEYPIACVRIFELCTDDIQRFINKLADDGYSMSTIKKAYNLLTGFVRFLLGEGLMVRSAYLNVNLPKPEKIKTQPRHVEVYDPDEQSRLRAAIQASGTIGAKAALLMLETGMRVGEVLALQWDDILWGRRALSIHSTLVFAGSRKRCFVQDSAKSRSSTRTIPLSKTAFDMLLALKDKCNSDGFVFSTGDCKDSVGYNSLRNQLKDLCQAANVPYKGFHVLRHTFATNAFYRGCEIKILSKLLGHASVTITYNTYIHLYGDALEEMRSIVG